MNSYCQLKKPPTETLGKNLTWKSLKRSCNSFSQAKIFCCWIYLLIFSAQIKKGINTTLLKLDPNRTTETLQIIFHKQSTISSFKCLNSSIIMKIWQKYWTGTLHFSGNLKFSAEMQINQNEFLLLDIFSAVLGGSSIEKNLIYTATILQKIF